MKGIDIKKDPTIPTSQDYDRKHGQDHTATNPRAAKELPSQEDDETKGKTTELIAKGRISNTPSLEPTFLEDKRKVDKRKMVREEHTNHFTNRASKTKK